MSTPCRIEGCSGPVNSNGLCAKHRQRERRNGDPLRLKGYAKTLGCAVVGCPEPHHANGWCSTHAARARRTGDPLTVRRESTLGSFWKRVDGGSVDACWIWRGFVLASGYGQIATRIKPTASGTRLAHRVAYELLIGDVPDGLVLDHLCRNRICVNPWHLDPVTPLVNTRRGLKVPPSVRAMYGTTQGVGR